MFDGADAGLKWVRIDGSVAGRDRQGIIDTFNAGSNSESRSAPNVCLLSTKACGFGVTLTGADRVIIFDPSWNPAGRLCDIYQHMRVLPNIFHANIAD